MSDDIEDASLLFVRRGDKTKGPLSVKRLLQLADAGRLKATDSVAETCDGPWRACGSESLLQAAFSVQNAPSDDDDAVFKLAPVPQSVSAPDDAPWLSAINDAVALSGTIANETRPRKNKRNNLGPANRGGNETRARRKGTLTCPQCATTQKPQQECHNCGFSFRHGHCALCGSKVDGESLCSCKHGILLHCEETDNGFCTGCRQSASPIPFRLSRAVYTWFAVHCSRVRAESEKELANSGIRRRHRCIRCCIDFELGRLATNRSAAGDLFNNEKLDNLKMTDKRRVRFLLMHLQTVKDQIRRGSPNRGAQSPFLSPGEMAAGVLGVSLLGPFGMALAAKKHSDRVAAAQPTRKALRQHSQRVDLVASLKWLLRDFHEVTNFQHSNQWTRFAAVARELMVWSVAIIYGLSLAALISSILYFGLMA